LRSWEDYITPKMATAAPEGAAVAGLLYGSG
jgi:hypothetical protein